VACTVLHRIAFPVVSEWCQLHPCIHFDNDSLALVFVLRRKAPKAPIASPAHSLSLHRRVHLQPIVETPRMRPVVKGSLDGVVAFYWFEEIVRGVLGFGLARVMDLETLYLE
jgi:hypothetical protein